MRALAPDEYANSAHAILRTVARWSYVLIDRDVYWCVEWPPGLLVVRFSPGGSFGWCALRSPNPSFGGKVATEAELDAFDEDAPNPQYNLVFDAWDAQWRPDELEQWNPASQHEIECFEAAMSAVDAIGARLEAECADPEAYNQWLARSRASALFQGSSES
jgi:hypothetical protein